LAGECAEDQLRSILSKYAGERAELIPILSDVQDAFGYIPAAAMGGVAEFLRIPDSSVYGVATFYAQFHFTRQGRHKVKVCQGTACHVRGGRRVLKAVQDRLGIKPGQTTADYQFSLERVACFGSCALAPVMVVDGQVHGRMTPQKAQRILEELR
jgi:NADH-quinone oxidoreductase subunit E